MADELSATEKMPVFSPSQTNTFGFCPRKWALDREGWVTRLVEWPELCGILGTGYAASMESYNKRQMTGDGLDLDAAIEAGVNNTAQAIKAIALNGRHIESIKDKDLVNSYPKLIQKAVEHYHKHNPYTDCKILAVERTYPDFGWCRIDLLVETPQHDIVVVDYKLKLKLEAAWRAKEEHKYDDHWNMMHYAWATGATSYAICMMVLAPLGVKSIPYAINPGYHYLWGSDAQGIWNHMQLVKDKKMVPYGNPKHYDEYGDCVYRDPCTRMGLSTQQMAVQFVQITRRKHGQVDTVQPGGAGVDGGGVSGNGDSGSTPPAPEKGSG